MYKNILSFIVLVIILTSCSYGNELKNLNRFTDYDIIVIDSCQYIMYGTKNGYLNITHKGNCNRKHH